VGGAVGLAAGVVPGHGAFDDAGAYAALAGGAFQLARTRRPILPARSMLAPAMTPAARVTWSRATSGALAKLARSGSAPGTAASAIAVRRAW
jgi:hypothetical protein